MKLIRKGFLSLNIILIVATLLAYLAPYVSPEQFWLMTFFGLAYPLLLFLHVLFMGVWFFFEKKLIFPSLITILLGWTHLTGIINLNFSANKKSAQTIRVMSYNVRLLGQYDHNNDKDRITTARQILQPVIDQKPDILFLQEMGRNHLSETHHIYLTEKAALKYAHWQGSGPHIISRYPLLNKGKIQFEDSGNAAVFADIKVNDQIIRVYNVHLQSLRFEEKDFETIKKPDPRQKDTPERIKNIGGKIKRAAAQRAAQAEQVAAHINASPYPVIIGADLNDTPSTYSYKQIAQSLKDAFREKGHGLGSTYAGPIPAQRIDFLFASKSFEIGSYQRIKQKLSDHYPIFCTLEPKP